MNSSVLAGCINLQLLIDIELDGEEHCLAVAGTQADGRKFIAKLGVLASAAAAIALSELLTQHNIGEVFAIGEPDGA